MLSLLAGVLTGGEMKPASQVAFASKAAGPSFDELALSDLFSQIHAAPVVVPAVTVERDPAPVEAPPAVEPDAAAATAYVTAPTEVGGCPALIIEVFGINSPAACAVSLCESGWNPNATGAEGEMGYFQIHPRWHPDATYDPRGNVLAAYRISGGGYDWSQWTCRRVLN